MIFYRNIEDILAEKGESVKRLTENDSLEYLVKDLANRIEKGEPSKDEDWLNFFWELKTCPTTSHRGYVPLRWRHDPQPELCVLLEDDSDFGTKQ